MNPRDPPGPGLWQRLAAQFSWGGRASGLGGLCGLCQFGALGGCLDDPGIPRLGAGHRLQTCWHLIVTAWGEAAMFRNNYSVLYRGIRAPSLAVSGMSSRHHRHSSRDCWQLVLLLLQIWAAWRQVVGQGSRKLGERESRPLSEKCIILRAFTADV